MAVNVWTSWVFWLQVAFWCTLCVTRTYTFIPYAVSKDQQSLSLNPFQSLRFHSYAHSRFRRQSSSDSDGVSADTATNSGVSGQALPDESSQPVSPEATSSVKNASTHTAVSTSTVAPQVSATTARLQNSESPNEEKNATSDDDRFDPDIIHDYHNYYVSDSVSKQTFSEHWIELENAPKHDTLSSGHRVAAVFSLKFDFYFYGHRVTNVTVATGGFIYMSPFLHQWLTATQYIAPLMANFDPSSRPDSNIYVQSNKDKFIVEWENLVLKDQNSSGRFHFQAILNDDSSIKFVYKSIPIPVSNISHDEHPVKVGLSDAYYNDTYIPETNIKRRTIYEYHKVALPFSWVASGRVIILTPLPTCNRLTDCDSCVKHVDVKFNCRWCNTLGRCSDGLDWYRQHWDREGCQNSQTNDSAVCPLPTTSVRPLTDSLNPSSDNNCNHTDDARICSSLPPSSKPNADPLNDKGSCSNGKCSVKSDFPVAVVVIVVLIACGLFAALALWVYYAYTHPTSRSGMWLMEHRPSQLKSRIKFWKSSSDGGTKYKVESDA